MSALGERFRPASPRSANVPIERHEGDGLRVLRVPGTKAIC